MSGARSEFRGTCDRYVTSDIHKPFEVQIQGIQFSSLTALLAPDLSRDPRDSELRQSVYGRVFDSVDVRVAAQLFSNGQELCRPCYSSYIHCTSGVSKFTNGKEGRAILFPLEVADLPLDVQIVFSVYEAPFQVRETVEQTYDAGLVGSGCLRLFDKQGIALAGPDEVPIRSGLTPAAASSLFSRHWTTEAQRLETLAKRLNQLTAADPSDIIDVQLAKVAEQRIEQLARQEQEAAVVLQVQLPRLRAALVHESCTQLPPPPAVVPPDLLLAPGQSILLFDSDSPYAVGGAKISIPQSTALCMARYDFTNRLGQAQSRSQDLDAGLALVNVKPTPSESDQLKALCRDWAWCLGLVRSEYKSQLPPISHRVVWHYRYWLRWQPGGLIPLVWAATSSAHENAGEQGAETVEHELATVLSQWSGQVSTAEILTLLLPEFSPPFCLPLVRRFGIELLQGLPTTELSSILNQIVQACRWDLLAQFPDPRSGDEPKTLDTEPGELSQMLLERSTHSDIAFVCRLYWLLQTECDVIDAAIAGTPGMRLDTVVRVESPGRGRREPLAVRVPVESEAQFYRRLRTQFLATLGAQAPELSRLLHGQIAWMARLTQVLKQVAREDAPRTEKIALLRQTFLLPENTELASPSIPVRSPVHPLLVCDQVAVDELHIFKSARQPARVTLVQAERSLRRTDSEVDDSFGSLEGPQSALHEAASSLSGAAGGSLPAKSSTESAPRHASARLARSTFIYKMHDDVRQDQLVQQLFWILNNQVNRVLDMRMRPYSAISTSVDAGVIEIVPHAQTVQDIILRERTIARFLRESNEGADGVPAAEVQENYIRSCAGYTVLTYLFGIGDRHLENLMLQPDGHFFHIDFGFILGRDPKVADQTVKLNQHLLQNATSRVPELMALAVEVFNQCRRHAPLVLTLFRHMRYSRIRTVEEEADSDFRIIYSRFLVDHSDTEASQIFANIIKKALSEVMPQVIDKLHMWVQYFRD